MILFIVLVAAIGFIYLNNVPGFYCLKNVDMGLTVVYNEHSSYEQRSLLRMVTYMSRIIENPKQLILDTAKDILFNKGYKELSMRNVAKACDIAIGTIYNYYPTKRDLVVEMMAEHWHEYFNVLEKIMNDDRAFFVRLHAIFEELETVIKSFREIWLTPELYQTPDYVEKGVARESIYMENLIKRLDSFLVSEAAKSGAEITLKNDSYMTAQFILLNFITMIQMPVFKYETFELFLKQLL